MPKKKYYAVKKGKTIGVFEKWEECKKSIAGYKGALHKSFSTKEEAQAFVDGVDFSKEDFKKSNNLNCPIIYIDGSYDKTLKRYSYGCVFIKPDGEQVEIKGFDDDQLATESGNVAGELLGAMIAIKWVVTNDYKKAIIKYDYEGIEKWYKGDWKAKSYCARKYIEFTENYKNDIIIEFEKVKAHMGNEFNELADKLAKEALKSKIKKEKVNSGESHFTLKGIECEEIEQIIELVNCELENQKLDILKNEESTKKTFTLKKQKETIYIICYNTGTTLIQGKQEKLFSMVSSYIATLLNCDDITPTLNKYHNIDIKPEEIDIEVVKYLPDIKIYHSEKYKSAIYQSVYNLLFDGNMYDFTFLLHPVMRALDGNLRYLMKKYKIEMKDRFDMFESVGINAYRIKENYKENFGDKTKVSFITRLYSHYKKHRDPLFHWDTPIGKFDTTRVIESKKSVNNIIINSLNLINESYKVL